MKILFSPNENIINKNIPEEWGVDMIVLPSEIRDFSLPEGINEFILFFPTIINQDFALNYDGVEYALHFYFHILRRKQLLARIVLLGIENSNSFMMRCPYPKILRCPGFDYILLNKHFVSNYSKKTTELDITKSKKTIEQLGLKLPESYRSNHSFINEWCYYKWSDYMGFDNSKVLKKLENNIFFDYLRTVQGWNVENDKNVIKSEKIVKKIKRLKGKILLIDDSQYWHDFFENLFMESSVQLKPLELDFNNKQVEDIVTSCVDAYNEFNPDVILLDFRLNEDRDYDVSDRKDISGVQVLRALKGTEENPNFTFGSKVIMFSATGKIDHVFALQRFRVDDFIFKEHPESFVGKSKSGEILSKTIDSLSSMLTCAYYSKHIHLSFGDWYTIIPESKNGKDALCKKTTVANRVRQVIIVVNDLLNGNFYNKQRLKLIYLECFSIIEYLKPGNSSVFSFIECFLTKHSLWLKYKDLWENINEMRNSLAHGSETTTINKADMLITPQLVATWLVKLCKFVTLILKLYY